MVYILELATILTLRDVSTIEALGESLASTLQGLVRSARNLHPLVTSRVVSYLLNALRLSYVGFLFPFRLRYVADSVRNICASLSFFMAYLVLIKIFWKVRLCRLPRGLHDASLALAR